MKRLNKIAVLIGMVLTINVVTHAQVLIKSMGPDRTPVPQAVLELWSDTAAFLPPRVQLQDTAIAQLTGAVANTHVPGLVVYNTKTDLAKGLEPGLYYNDGAKWVRLINSTKPAMPKWFYMPSIIIDVSSDVTMSTIHLYDEYLKQFNHGITGSLLISSNTLKPDIPYINSADKLDYYITAYDTAVFTIHSLNTSGDMVYSVNSSNVSDSTYINIVFVEK
jgi:hypothetical protein